MCDLQLRSYSVQNVEFFADFAIRAAYYLNLPVSGPVPLPRIVERWTVPRSNFVHKKSQENFERITLRRLIQIKDGNPQAVQAWLAFLRKHAFYGVGMKANVWEHDSLGTVPHVKANRFVPVLTRSQTLANPWMHLFRKLRRHSVHTLNNLDSDRITLPTRAYSTFWTATGLPSAKTSKHHWRWTVELCIYFRGDIWASHNFVLSSSAALRGPPQALCILL